MFFFQIKDTSEKNEMRIEILTVINHLKVELFVAVYFNEMFHCYDEAQLQYRQTWRTHTHTQYNSQCQYVR